VLEADDVEHFVELKGKNIALQLLSWSDRLSVLAKICEEKSFHTLSAFEIQCRNSVKPIKFGKRSLRKNAIPSWSSRTPRTVIH